MQTFSFRAKKTASHHFVISILLILLLFSSPLPAVAQDTGTIETLRQTGKAFARIAEQASPAVVGIKAEKTITQEYPTTRQSPFGSPFFDDDFFDYFFRRSVPNRRSPQRKYHQQYQGSGFIISSDGYILTNNHLVGESDKVTVMLSDSRELEAKIIGTDPESDIAVIKIDAGNLPTLKLADSDALEVGEWVLAIGNPFGLSHTVTAGIVSAKGRSGIGVAAYEDFIQTDAAINPGNSGGPLLDLDGRVIGINTAIISRSGGNMGIGLAIPVNIAKNVYNQLIKGGTVVRGYLGVMIEDLKPEMADYFGLKDAKGVILPEVMKDSAAEKAGLKSGDIVIEFEGQPVENAREFRNHVAMLKPGTKVKMVVLRDGRRKTFTVELGKRPGQTQIAAEQPVPLEQLGLTVQALTNDLAEQLGYKQLTGVVVSSVEPGSLAYLAGIRRGMLIIEVNQTQVSNVEDFNTEFKKAEEKGMVLFLINNGQYNQYIVLTLPKK